MAQARPTSLMDLSPSKLQGLSPQLRRAARFVVENPGDVATRSQRHVASAAQLPAPTFTRLARAISLGSYDQLRELCRVEVLHNRTLLADKARALTDQKTDARDPVALLVQHAVAAIRNVQTLVERNDHQQMLAAARVLAGAKTVVLVGEMSARGMVEYACYIAKMSLSGWKVLGRGGEGLSFDLADLGPEDACIFVSISPYSSRAVKVAALVQDCEVPLIAVTDNALSPAAALANHCFFVGTESPQFFPTHVPAMVVLETLVDMVIRERGAEAQQHIAAVERQNHKLNEYWQDGPAANGGD